MKYSVRAIGAILLLATAVLWAEGPDDHYVRVYSLIMEGDALNDAGQGRMALAKYTEAQTALSLFPGLYPGWNENVIRFRLNYLNAKMAPLLGKFPSTNAVPARVVTAPAVPTVKTTPPENKVITPEAPVTPAPVVSTAADRELQEELRRSQAENARLAAKLREALSAQPPAVDARELAKVQERNKSLQRENDLLKVSLGQEQARTAKLTPASPTISPLPKGTPAEEARTLSALRTENELLKKRTAELESKNAAATRQLTQQLEQSRATIVTLTAQSEKYRSENSALEKRMVDLETRLAKAPAPAADAGKTDSKKVKQLKEELDKQATAAKGAARESEMKIARLEKENVQLVKGKAALEAKLTASASEATALEIKRRKQLEEELAGVRAKLEKAEKQLDKRAKNLPADAQKELVALRALVAVLEAKPVPYTAEELAVLSQPGVTFAATTADPKPAAVVASRDPSVETKPVAPRKPLKRLPPNSAPLEAAARKAFSAHNYEEAENKYLEILRLDPKNVLTLGDLASIQTELKKLDAAETNLTTALSVDPQDDFCLYLMGRVKFLRGKTDDALVLLSQAAKANPDSIEAQNFLGIALSEKGLRSQAETAFRKVIQLQPDNANAHNNLAFVYATQKPPLLALARWHYQKALAGGHARNPEIEKLLETK
jgi:tetratricopeptide (TPR) repeat protein